MKSHRLTLILSALILALLTWYFWPGAAPATSAPAVPSAPAPSSPPASPYPAPAAGEPSPLAATLNAPSATIQADLRVVADLLGTFRTNFPRSGNPVGTNAEITAALTGQNPLHLVLIPRDHPAINRATGELCDRWGTPFFFHAESGTHMTVVSAGPDRKHHTADDEAFAP